MDTTEENVNERLKILKVNQGPGVDELYLGY